MRLILETGTRMGEEGREILGAHVCFRANGEPDELLDRFGDRHMISEMRKVFFADSTNTLGHNYAGLMRGPGGRSDLQDVVALLRREPASKRALVTLCGTGTGKVPCINAIQFLVRSGAVQTMYFARGQDAFRKFYADGLCLAVMAQRIAAALELETGWVSGFIGSSHFYDADLPAIRETLERAGQYLEKGEVKGAPA